MKLADMYFYLSNDTNKEIDTVIVFVEPGGNGDYAFERASESLRYGAIQNQVIRNVEMPDEAEYDRPYVG